MDNKKNNSPASLGDAFSGIAKETSNLFSNLPSTSKRWAVKGAIIGGGLYYTGDLIFRSVIVIGTYQLMKAMGKTKPSDSISPTFVLRFLKSSLLDNKLPLTKAAIIGASIGTALGFFAERSKQKIDEKTTAQHQQPQNP